MIIEENGAATPEETGAEETTPEETGAESKETDAEVIEKTLTNTGDDDDDDSDDKDDEAGEKKDDEEASTKFEMPELGEGVEFDTELFKAMTPVLEKMGATQEHVNELSKAYLGHIKKAADIHGEKLIEKYQEIKDGWKNEAKKELGANFKQEILQVGTAMKKFGSEKLVELFDETGVGNHVEVVKFMSKVGKHFVEDDMEDGDGKGSDESAEDVLYPTMN